MHIEEAATKLCHCHRSQALSDLAGASAGLNSSDQPVSAVEGVLVLGLEAALLGDLGGAGAAEDVADVAGEAGLVAVEVGDDGAVDIVKDVVLGQHLGAHAAVDARGRAVLEDRVEDVARAEAQRGQAGADVDEGVVVVGDAQLALVLCGVAVRVADQASLLSVLAGVACHLVWTYGVVPAACLP